MQKAPHYHKIKDYHNITKKGLLQIFWIKIAFNKYSSYISSLYNQKFKSIVVHLLLAGCYSAPEKLESYSFSE